MQDALEHAQRKRRLFGDTTGRCNWLLTIMHNVWTGRMSVVRIHEA